MEPLPLGDRGDILEDLHLDVGQIEQGLCLDIHSVVHVKTLVAVPHDVTQMGILFFNKYFMRFHA